MSAQTYQHFRAQSRNRRPPTSATYNTYRPHPTDRRITPTPNHHPAATPLPSSRHPQTSFFQADDGIRVHCVTGVQTCALPISPRRRECATAPLGCQQCLNIIESSSRTPYVEEWSFSIQRQLSPSWVLESAYFGSHGVKLVGQRSEERRVGEECRSRWSTYHYNK